MANRSLEGEDTWKFINDNLVLKFTDSIRWQSTYEDHASCQLWLLDYPDSAQHGGGTPRLRSLPLDRMAIMEVLLQNLHLSVDERYQLGTDYALESELAQLIAIRFKRAGWYPPDARPWPVNGAVFEDCVLQRIASAEVKLWCQRHAAISTGSVVQQSETTFGSVDEAVLAFIRKQWPQKQIDGIRITDR